MAGKEELRRAAARVTTPGENGDAQVERAVNV